MSNAFNDPTHATLLKIWREMEVPGFVKEAQSVDEQNFNVVDVDHFGDPANRLYPLNTKSNTWLSREHFNRDKPGLNKAAAEIIESRITKAASFWNLDEPIRLQEEPLQHTIHHITIEDDVEREEITLDITGHYKAAAEAFCEQRNLYSYSMRRSFAKQMLEAPAEVKEPLNPDTEQMLCKMANYGTCTAENARNAVWMRMLQIKRKDPETFGQLAKVAHAVSQEVGLIHVDTLHKVAKLLDAVDRTHGLHARYGREMNAPEDDLFHFTEKRANAIRDEAVILADDTIVNRNDLIGYKEQIDEYFQKIAGGIPYSDDDSMVEEIVKLHERDIPTLLNFLEV